MMTIFESVGKTYAAAMRPGFVPCDAEGAIAAQLLRPRFDDDRESVLLAAFDAFERLVGFESIDSETPRRCVVPPRCWRRLLVSSTATVLVAHNHPSGIAWPSDADIAATHEVALFLRTIGIDLADHLIFVSDGHFSFRTAEML